MFRVGVVLVAVREGVDRGWGRGAEWFRAVRFVGQESKVRTEP